MAEWKITFSNLASKTPKNTALVMSVSSKSKGEKEAGVDRRAEDMVSYEHQLIEAFLAPIRILTTGRIKGMEASWFEERLPGTLSHVQAVAFSVPYPLYPIGIEVVK